MYYVVVCRHGPRIENITMTPVTQLAEVLLSAQVFDFARLRLLRLLGLLISFGLYWQSLGKADMIEIL